GVDGEDNGLGAKFQAQLGEQLGAADRGRVDRYFVRARHQDAARVGDRANAATHRERDEHLARCAEYHVRHDGALVARRGDVEEDDFVGALLVVAVREFHRVARIAQVDEVDAFHHTAAGDVETGYDALGQHSSEFQKVAYDLKSHGAGFFRMELDSENVSIFEHRGVR